MKNREPSVFFVPTLLFVSALLMCVVLPPFAVSTDSAAISGLEPYATLPEDVDCIASTELALPILARAIEQQMEGRPYVLRVAFGAVIVNRARSGSFGGSISAVLSAAGIYPADNITPSERSLRAAKEALLGTDPTLGALYILSGSDPALPEYESKILVRIADLVFIR